MNKQNPFSLYDFLGYLIPGGLLVYSILAIRFIENSDVVSLELFIENFSRLNFEKVFIFVIIAYALGHIVSFVSSITVELYANLKYNYPSKYLLGHRKIRFWKKFHLKFWKQNFWRGMLVFILMPIVILDFIFGQFLGLKTFYQKPVDSFLKESINQKVLGLIIQLGLTQFNPVADDFHRIVSHYTFENAKQHQFRMVNYVALYGFLRNLAFIFNLLSWYYIMHLIKDLNFKNALDYEKIFFVTVLFSIAYISFMAFMKFYRRYTLEGFMLIVVDENIKTSFSPKPYNL